jgi:hypothetical protein
MVLVGAFIAIPALVMLAVCFRRPQIDEGWRGQAEGLRERFERRG